MLLVNLVESFSHIDEFSIPTWLSTNYFFSATMAITRAKLLALPTELKLQILRRVVLDTPPRINERSQLVHPLLSPQLFRLRSEVLDVIFHTASITVSCALFKDWDQSSRAESAYRGRFLILHHQAHGLKKRRLIRLEIMWSREEALNIWGSSNRHHTSISNTARAWAKAVGIRWSNVKIVGGMSKSLVA